MSSSFFFSGTSPKFPTKKNVRKRPRAPPPNQPRSPRERNQRFERLPGTFQTRGKNVFFDWSLRNAGLSWFIYPLYQYLQMDDDHGCQRDTTYNYIYIYIYVVCIIYVICVYIYIYNTHVWWYCFQLGDNHGRWLVATGWTSKYIQWGTAVIISRLQRTCLGCCSCNQPSAASSTELKSANSGTISQGADFTSSKCHARPKI